MSRLRIARIITRLNVGGPSIQALLLTRALDPARYETLLVCGSTGPTEGDMLALRPEERIAPVRVPELARDVSPFADLRALVRLVRILRRLRPHIVHTHLSKAGLLGRLAARLVSTPVVVHTFHGNVLSGYFGAPVSGLLLQLERLLARITTCIVAISPRQAGELRRLGIARGNKLVEIPLGVELAPFLDPPRGRLRAELGLGADDPIVGIVARLVPIKGVDLFLEAATKIAAERPAVTFVVVGDGEFGAELRRRAQALGIAAQTRFLGWRSDLPGIYGDLDVVALTSRNEGTPVSLIEALAAGRAVAATAVGGVPDLVDESCGVLCQRDDVRGISRAVVSLLDDPERRRLLGRRGRERVYPAYDAATLVERIDALYSSLAGGAR